LYTNRCPLTQDIAIGTIKMNYLNQTSKKRVDKLYEARNKILHERRVKSQSNEPKKALDLKEK